MSAQPSRRDAGTLIDSLLRKTRAREGRVASSLALALVTLVAFCALAGVAGAATILVDSDLPFPHSPGDGNCTLNEAIANANADNNVASGTDCAAGSGTDTIVLEAGVTYPPVSCSANSITTPIVIEGNGATIQTGLGAPFCNFLKVSSGGDLTLRHATVRDGGNNAPCLQVTSLASATVEDTTFRNCFGNSSLWIVGTDANLTMRNSAVDPINSPTLSLNTTGILNIINSTLGDLALSSFATNPLNRFEHVTVRQLINSGSVTVQNSIITNGCVGFHPISGGYNVSAATSCGFNTMPGDVEGVPIQFSNSIPLDNGGPTPTQGLAAISPAVDRIPPGTNGCGTTITEDQRHFQPRPFGLGCDSGAFERLQNCETEVSEFDDYTLVYELDLPDNADYNAGTPPYSVDDTTSIAAFDRVAYCLELDNGGSGLDWVWVSMDDFTGGTVTHTGVPVSSTGAIFETGVGGITDMNVFSNVAGVVTSSGIATGNLEFWHNGYTSIANSGVSGSSSRYDFDDMPSGSNLHGSLQVHNYGASQTVFAWNAWDSNDADAVGIGSRPSGEPDWTFAANAPSHTVRKNLRVFVREPTCTDGDGDGYGNPGDASCTNGAATDCNDGDSAINPGATEILCDAIDQNCNGNGDDDVNADGDPVTFCAGDCDDGDSDNYPGNTEVCDGQDNDCDSSVDEGFDNDSDGTADCFDTDDDNDGVLDAAPDLDPLDPDVCEDTDADTCDDCAVGTDDFGPLADNDPANDGPDGDGDGLCDAGDPTFNCPDPGTIDYQGFTAASCASSVVKAKNQATLDAYLVDFGVGGGTKPKHLNLQFNPAGNVIIPSPCRIKVLGASKLIDLTGTVCLYGRAGITVGAGTPNPLSAIDATGGEILMVSEEDKVQTKAGIGYAADLMTIEAAATAEIGSGSTVTVAGPLTVTSDGTSSTSQALIQPGSTLMVDALTMSAQNAVRLRDNTAGAVTGDLTLTSTGGVSSSVAEIQQGSIVVIGGNLSLAGFSARIGGSAGVDVTGTATLAASGSATASDAEILSNATLTAADVTQTAAHKALLSGGATIDAGAGNVEIDAPVCVINGTVTSGSTSGSCLP